MAAVDAVDAVEAGGKRRVVSIKTRLGEILVYLHDQTPNHKRSMRITAAPCCCACRPHSCVAICSAGYHKPLHVPLALHAWPCCQ